MSPMIETAEPQRGQGLIAFSPSNAFVTRQSTSRRVDVVELNRQPAGNHVGTSLEHPGNACARLSAGSGADKFLAEYLSVEM
jgi:hypothetical protein